MSILDAAAVQRTLTAPTKAKLVHFEAFTSIASTNTHLLSQPAPKAGCFRVAVTDQQTSGRGRRLRRWISPPGSGLCLSLAYSFVAVPSTLSALTLALGVGVAKSLQTLGAGDVQLKWPNDVLAGGGKLGGILTEAQSGAAAGASVVAGVGLNVDLTEQPDVGVDSGWSQRAVDLKSIVATLPEREDLAGSIIEHLFATCVRFDAFGFADFVEDWQRLDWLRGREVTVKMPDRHATGVAAGVDTDGSLLVDDPSGRMRVVSGSILAVGPKAGA